MFLQHGMSIDVFFSQNLELFLRAQDAASEPETVYIDEL
nr:MAG TPA: hypothetical protein [Caudoviricetes sp.]DAT22013.1 MAG TPA: hypothetical protein [Caudoviricetes sp.]DAU49045.1 MAG TPA: hypothetical protein [Caudoviricetes sp.]